MPDPLASARPRRSKAEQRAETLEQILDAAALLFSRFGLAGVTLRDVAGRVGVHASLLHYYFDDKAELFRAVFERRADAVAGRRMAALDRYEAEAGDDPTVEGALHAFLGAELDLYRQGGEVWMNYAAFCARVGNTPEGVALMEARFDPMARLVGLLKRALPDVRQRAGDEVAAPEDVRIVGVQARTGRIDRLSAGLCRSDDVLAAGQRIARFMAAGLLALAEPNRAPAF